MSQCMLDLEIMFHKRNRSEKLDQQIIVGEADVEMHGRALSRLT